MTLEHAEIQDAAFSKTGRHADVKHSVEESEMLDDEFVSNPLVENHSPCSFLVVAESCLRGVSQRY